MKKTISVFVFVLILHLAQAQNVSMGISGGVHHSWLTGYENVKFKPGINPGVMLTFSPAPHWGLGGDIRLSFLEGVKTGIESAGKRETSKINATYLRVPLKATYFFGEFGDKVRPKLYAGPSFGFLLGGRTNTSNSNVETKSADVLKGSDWGFIAGGGFNYRLKANTWFNFDVAYTNGLKDATEAPGFHANRNIALNAGVTFPLGTAIMKN
jgi:hypothetical protein